MKVEISNQKKAGNSVITWILNNILLHNQWTKEEITKEIRKYFVMNEIETKHTKMYKCIKSTAQRLLYGYKCLH